MSRRGWFGRVKRSGRATAGDGSFINTGIIVGDIPSNPVRSAYLRRVQEIFTGELKDREHELAELAAFCTDTELSVPGYVWWQGEAWTGKSALMATFAQNPPAGVRVVSFFITARWAGQSDRVAFFEAILPQLMDITGQSLPGALSEASRQEWFLRLMDEAAQTCVEQGSRLVLLIDGLDEDRGVTTGPHAHSIAAILPAKLSHGARVVVSGRPNPPVPSDVPPWHPLCDPQIVRPLASVSAAQATQRQAERELAHLIDEGGLGRDLLAALVAAGGGLSPADLAELTDMSQWEAERILQTVRGRTFTGRDSTWRTGAGPLLVLGHEELQQTALHCLRDELPKWRERLHIWADDYRQRGWPAGTPEYLLRGYLQMLREIGDLPQMVALMLDQNRLDRMLDVSGGDAAAMADITTVQECIRDQPPPI